VSSTHSALRKIDPDNPTQDSLQAFSSSIAGLLASRAVLEGKFHISVVLSVAIDLNSSSSMPSQAPPGPLGPAWTYAGMLIKTACHSRASIPVQKLQSLTISTGVGVGDASASPTAALLLSVVQESMGRIVTILFAHKLGTSLEPECKMYRLAADIFNDTAMILDCLSPAFPKAARVLILSFSSVLRSLCGVCAGSAKASLSAHFAKRGNLGELNAVSLCFC
jgi:hypothetical protein